MKLRDYRTWPPGGWSYFDPKINYRQPDPMAYGFTETAAQIAQARANNRHIYKEASERTVDSATRALELYTALRLARAGHWHLLVIEPEDEALLAKHGIAVKKKLLKSLRTPVALRTPVPSPPRTLPPAVPGAAPVAGARARAGQVATAASTLQDWLGAGGQPVPAEQSTTRAAICAARLQPDGSTLPCPRNDTRGSWWDWFTGAAAAVIKAQLEHRSQLKLSTPHDAKLGVCDACGCQLQLKVHVPLEHIVANLDPAAQWALDPHCWILHETEQSAPTP